MYCHVCPVPSSVLTKAGDPAVPALAIACLCHIQQSCNVKQTGAFHKLHRVLATVTRSSSSLQMLSLDQCAWSCSAAYAAKHAENDASIWLALQHPVGTVLHDSVANTSICCLRRNVAAGLNTAYHAWLLQRHDCTNLVLHLPVAAAQMVLAM